jgi:hypothetical protein
MIAVMPNRAIEFHDAVLASVSFSRGEAQLHLSSVCVHQSEGVPGRDPGSGWVQQAILRLRHPRVEGAFSVLPVDLSEGQIQMENKGFDNEIPVPLRHEGAHLSCVYRPRGKNKELSLTGAPARNWNWSVSRNCGRESPTAEAAPCVARLPWLLDACL